MKIQRKSSVVIALVFSALMSNSVSAWDDTVTHPALTERAINQLKDNWFAPYLQNNLGFKNNVREKLPYENEQMTILDILKDGSVLEDDEVLRRRHHFHSPITDMGQSGFTGGESAFDWARGAVRA